MTFTTLGFGDITLDENWRLVSSFEAANGLLMFGWSTALIFAAVQWVYAGRQRPPRLEEAFEDVNSVAGLYGIIGWDHDGRHDAAESPCEADEALFGALGIAF